MQALIRLFFRPRPQVAPGAPLRIGQIWQHRNGNRYRIYDFTNRSSTRRKYPPMVSYVNTANGEKFSRRCDDWHRSMSIVHDVFSPG